MLMIFVSPLRRLQVGTCKRQRAGQLEASEIMTILVHFHQSRDRDFKAFYTQYVRPHLRADFPGWSVTTASCN